MLHQHSFRAMNTHVGIWLWSNAPAATAALREGEAFFARVETALSRFRPHSELSRLNAAAGKGPRPVSRLLYTVLAQALSWASKTQGIYDPTVLPALLAAGYDCSFDRLSPTSSRPAHPPAEGTWGQWSAIQLDPVDLMVELPAGVQVDLGGIAKGWTVDQVAEMLAPWGPVLVDAGGDIRAIGLPGDAPWPIAVQDPFQPEVDCMVLDLAQGGLATSSIGGRRWIRGGVLQHHLIDPRTGRPAQSDLHTVTVWAPTVVEAEIGAKVALILGSQDGAAFLRQRGWRGWLWTRGGNRHEVAPEPQATTAPDAQVTEPY